MKRREAVRQLAALNKLSGGVLGIHVMAQRQNAGVGA